MTQELTDINDLYLLFYLVFYLVPGHVTLGTAPSAGPPHLILISLCSSLLLCAV